MATIDLGKIKLVNKNTWDTNTTYTADDIVQYTDNGILSTYICVVASSQGHTPSSSGTTHASWNFLAKGIADPIPSQSGHASKALVTDGSSLSWGSSKGSVINMYHFYHNGVASFSTSGQPQLLLQSTTITPVSANSAFYVIGQVCGATGNDGSSILFQFSTNAGSSFSTGLIASNVGSRLAGHGGGFIMSDSDCMQSSVAMDYYDPNSTSNFVIGLAIQGHGGGTIDVNRDRNNTNSNHRVRGVSSFMVFEVDTTLTNNTQTDRG